MRELGEPLKVCPFVAMLSKEETLFDRTIDELTGFFGAPLTMSRSVPWEHSSYYEVELGRNLLRKFVFFSRLMDPGDLVESKRLTMRIERDLGEEADEKISRRINIDPGYMTRAKLVLGTSKDFSHRIYIGGGIYAEVTLYFKDGSFRPFFYTYRDYKDEENISLFNEVRGQVFGCRCIPVEDTLPQNDRSR